MAPLLGTGRGAAGSVAGGAAAAEAAASDALSFAEGATGADSVSSGSGVLVGCSVVAGREIVETGCLPSRPDRVSTIMAARTTAKEPNMPSTIIVAGPGFMFTTAGTQSIQMGSIPEKASALQPGRR